ncbi:hypothetical protein [Pelagibacterium luteolum]|uniref:Uncharacterized protein n=1 Tax=Pelagibacterium luteolum TaxID=440168 RepID=A0A1G7V137_9HYPH|nr:hypothetical protein [Pelagibacterium luteolum]SDG53467.1 hypothetical protein SAMN04487974_103413 [Pelagibacterium luteolum]
MQRALVISKDRFNDLKKLARAAVADERSHLAARHKADAATLRATRSTAEFGKALYAFTLDYAANPALVDAKLKEVGATVKSTTSVYQRIARLAFDDVRDDNGAVQRSQVQKYGELIELAHLANATAAEFASAIEVSMTRVRERFGYSGPKNKDEKLELGKSIATDITGSDAKTVIEVELRGTRNLPFIQLVYFGGRGAPSGWQFFATRSSVTEIRVSVAPMADAAHPPVICR